MKCTRTKCLIIVIFKLQILTNFTGKEFKRCQQITTSRIGNRHAVISSQHMCYLLKYYLQFFISFIMLPHHFYKYLLRNSALSNILKL